MSDAIQKGTDAHNSIARALELINTERLRQILEEGYDSRHDADHQDGELAASACELIEEHLYQMDHGHPSPTDAPHRRRFGACWGLIEKHAKDPVKMLTIAGALIAAEIDRLLGEQS